MSVPPGWSVAPFSMPWDLCIRFHENRRFEGWYRLTGAGEVSELPLAANAYGCVVSPDGTRALVLRISSFHEQTDGHWTILRWIVDLRSGAAIEPGVAIGHEPAWSNDGGRFACWRTTRAWSSQERKIVSYLGDEWNVDVDAGEQLAVYDAGFAELRSTPTRPIHALRWRPGDREVVAVVGDRDRMSVVTYRADDLERVGEVDLPGDPEAWACSIAADGGAVAVSGDSLDEDDDGDPYTASVHDLADGRTVSLGPQCHDTSPVWSPAGRQLAYRHPGKVAGDDRQIMAVMDLTTEEVVELAAINEADSSGDIVGPAPAWSPDGRWLVFASFEEEGQALYLADVTRGTCGKILQTPGLIHALEILPKS